MIALPIVTLIWSYNWIVMKQVLQYSGPFEFSALRFLIGTVVLFGVMVWRREPLAPPPLLQTALLGLAQTAAFQAFVQCALIEGAAGRTALLAYTMPFWVVLLGWWLLAERPSLRLWAGLLVAAAGLLLVLEPWHGQTSLRSSMLAILGGVSWAFGVVLSKRMFRRGGVSALSLTAWQMLCGAVVLVAIALCAHERPIEWSAPFVGALVYNGILASGLAWLLWSFVVSRLPANIAGLSSLTVPIAGIALAWILLGERPSLTESLGIALIASALAIVTRPAAGAVKRNARSPAGNS
ncbi:MAG: EamA family transporter [Proteobacteria bacterium]|nr:EamA family transporter [Pseudomonadota bacterium]